MRFRASRDCCACGGGKYAEPHEYWMDASTCVDAIYEDRDGDGCGHYDSKPEHCGKYDDEVVGEVYGEDLTWTSNDACCACGGGYVAGTMEHDNRNRHY